MCVSVYFTATISLSETSSINVYCLINGSPISSFLLHLPKFSFQGYFQPKWGVGGI